MKISLLCAAGIALLPALARAADPAPLAAFPGAEGFGALATGGRGGEIVHVTTLADKGAGSLREAVSKPGRIVVFDVSGVIKLDSNLSIPDNMTLAGQSAPGEGICIYNRTVSISGSKNLIIRYLRFREGIAGDKGKCAINASKAENVILDHCSVEWGRWDCLGCTEGSHDITIQNCMIGEGLDPQRFGALVDSVENVTIARCLWMNNHSRNPKTKGSIQYVNNVVYDWGITGLAGGHSAADHQLDAINNYFIKGPASNNEAIGGYTDTDKVFSSGNMVDLDRDGKLNGRPVTEADFKDSKGAPTFAKAAWAKPKIPVTVLTAEEAYKTVAAGVGCSLHRDPVDERIIGELTSLGAKGAIIKDEADVGGIQAIPAAQAPKDSDGDGIPDEWETAHGMNPKDPSDAKKLDKSGYMAIEVYLNSLAK